MEVSGQVHASAALLPGNEPPEPIEYEAGWSPEPVWTTWREGKPCPYRDLNSDPSVVQPVASRCTDCANPALCTKRYLLSVPCWILSNSKILSCVWVTIDGFWNNERIYWTVWYSAWLHLKFTVTITSSLPLLGSGFQRRTFPFLWVPQRVPDISYQLLTATAHKDWTAVVL
jgi:hypothetical protein